VTVHAHISNGLDRYLLTLGRKFSQTYISIPYYLDEQF